MFFTRHAGTSKSFLVKELFQNFVIRRISCAIISSSGISGTVYDELGVSLPTVHAYCGLEKADCPWKQVVERSTLNNLVQERIERVQCIIWDEASMSSRRVFEITNFIPHIFSSRNDESKSRSLLASFCNCSQCQTFSMREGLCLNPTYFAKLCVIAMNWKLLRGKTPRKGSFFNV